jgi:hypothetical protein
VTSLRAIPWIFAWTQTRLILPAWLGVGEALQAATSSGKREVLRDMYEVCVCVCVLCLVVVAAVAVWWCASGV